MNKIEILEKLEDVAFFGGSLTMEEQKECIAFIEKEKEAISFIRCCKLLDDEKSQDFKDGWKVGWKNGYSDCETDKG